MGRRDAKVSGSIENPLTGERIVFRLTAEETGGELLEMDDFWARADHQTPEHLHPGMEERWQVIAGRVCFCIDGVEREAGPGDIVVAPAGSTHSARSVGEELVHLRIQMRPALRWQEFVERLFTLSRVEQTGEVRQPDPEALAALMAEFGSEISL